uniref:Uncharacterized protein n=1 Tax=Arundo donax TaxID=35708 RepID=A0A0A9FQJ7_ARUDO
MLSDHQRSLYIFCFLAEICVSIY